MIKKIFVDLDGVLADFCSAAFSFMGCEKPTCPIEMSSQFDKICTNSAFWEQMTNEYWVNIPKLEDAEEILVAVFERVQPDCVAILSSGACKPHAYAGKMQWILNHFPSLRKQLFVGSKKELLASPEALLIDDWEKNVEAFRQAGGAAILLPRPWNSLRNQETLTYLNEQLDHQFQRDWWQSKKNEPNSGATQKA